MIERGRKIKLLLTGGGTGGHLFPAIATAQQFQKQYPGTEVLFVGTKRKVDLRSLEQYGFRGSTVHCYGLKGKNIKELIKALAVLPLSFLQSLKIIKSFKPDIIVGVGGYVTGPVVAAGRMLNIPAVIHEQNSVPGLANKKLGKIVSKICLSMPGSGAEFDKKKIVYTGNPVRDSLLELSAEPREAQGKKKRCLLILGGSQGARWINQLVSETICAIDDEKLKSLRVIHQTGKHDHDLVKGRYSQKCIDAQVEPFFMEMDRVYRQADLLVSRAGATTLSELAVLGKPAILIPFPYAADNHQVKNGDYYVAGGGALMFKQSDLSAELLKNTLLDLLEDNSKLSSMAEAMKKLSFPDAAERIVTCCMEQIHHD